jgi:hypothetical protein
MALLITSVIGAIRLLDWFQEKIEDSDDFLKALQDWKDEIAKNHNTPRSVKRLINKLRFYAMLLRALPGQGDGQKISDRVVVTFGVMEERLDEVLNKGPVALSFSATQAKDLSALQTALTKHAAIFHFLKGSIEVGSEKNRNTA